MSNNGPSPSKARDSAYYRDYRARLKAAVPSVRQEAQELLRAERLEETIDRKEDLRNELEILQFPKQLRKVVKDAVNALNRTTKASHAAAQIRFKAKREYMKPIEDCQQAVRTGCVGLKDQAPISDELVWIGCNAHLDDPDFSTCPSLLAANQWVEIRTDPHLKRAFWQMLWAYRQGKIGQAPSPMSEDIEKVAETKEETEDEVDIAALERRLDRKLGVEGPGDANG